MKKKRLKNLKKCLCWWHLPIWGHYETKNNALFFCYPILLIKIHVNIYLTRYFEERQCILWSRAHLWVQDQWFFTKIIYLAIFYTTNCMIYSYIKWQMLKSLTRKKKNNLMLDGQKTSVSHKKVFSLKKINMVWWLLEERRFTAQCHCYIYYSLIEKKLKHKSSGLYELLYYDFYEILFYFEARCP